jgi:tetratricopeptide (TPR) repeat protein
MDFLIQNKFWILITLFCLFTVSFLWHISNLWGARSRGRRRSFQPSKRKSDIIVLTSMEKKLLKEAKSLLVKGKITSAARIFEQIGLHREAIQTLEDHGLIHEAAKILMRMGRHNRAGVIYARHGLWDFAAQCFRMAQMPLEVAKCAKESGDIKTAAEYFETAERFEEAADCLYQLGELKRSGLLYIRSGSREKAFTVYNQLGLQKNLFDYQFSSEESEYIADLIIDKDINSSKNTDGLAEILGSLNLSKGTIQKLVLQGSYRVAVNVIKKCKFDIGIQLVSEINYQSDQAERFGLFFMEANLFQYAGIVYEKANEFFKAAEFFEKAQDFGRAVYCYERAGIHDKAKALKSMSQYIKHEKPLNKSVGLEAKFALSDGPESSLLQSSAPEESTEILSVPHPIVSKQTSHDGLGNNMGISSSADPQIEINPLIPISNTNSLKEEPQEKLRFPMTGLDENSAEKREILPPIPFSPSELNITPVAEEAESSELKKVFGSIKFFTDLDQEQIDALWNLSVTKRFSENAKILTYQDEPLGIYVILKGSVNCFRNNHGQESFLDQMLPGESFGELWLLTDTPSTVSFIAASDAIIRIIYRVTFNGFLDSDGTVARKVYKRFTTRLIKRLLTNGNQKEKKTAS